MQHTAETLNNSPLTYMPEHQASTFASTTIDDGSQLRVISKVTNNTNRIVRLYFTLIFAQSFPMTGSEACKVLSNHLWEYEKTEILDFEQVYYFNISERIKQ